MSTLKQMPSTSDQSGQGSNHWSKDTDVTNSDWIRLPYVGVHAHTYKCMYVSVYIQMLNLIPAVRAKRKVTLWTIRLIGKRRHWQWFRVANLPQMHVLVLCGKGGVWQRQRETMLMARNWFDVRITWHWIKESGDLCSWRSRCYGKSYYVSLVVRIWG